MPSALIVEDDPNALGICAAVVEKVGFTVATAETLGAARARLAALPARPPDLVLLDLLLPDGSGMDLLRELRDETTADVILTTGHASVDTAVEAIRLGALDYMVKPLDMHRFEAALTSVLRTRESAGEIADVGAGLRRSGRFGALVGSCAPMRRAYDLVAKVAPTEATVMITGESGTGKELVARTIHQLSRRRDQPFLAVNCGAFSFNLIESELFGHERGSFTGAERVHRGYFERAHGGTLLLDEIGDMPMELQVKLLRILETRMVQRVGGSTPVPVDVRVLAATHRDLAAVVAAGQFREDLFYRLKVFPVALPPLRECVEDIRPLAEHFLAQLNRQEKTRKVLGRGAVAGLEAFAWPGNVRQLKHVIHRAFILAEREIGVEHLPREIASLVEPQAASRPGPRGRETDALSFAPGTPLAEMERRMIVASLRHFNQDKRQTADALGVSLKTLYNRLKAYQESAAPERTTN